MYFYKLELKYDILYNHILVKHQVKYNSFIPFKNKKNSYKFNT